MCIRREILTLSRTSSFKITNSPWAIQSLNACRSRLLVKDLKPDQKNVQTKEICVTFRMFGLCFLVLVDFMAFGKFRVGLFYFELGFW
jgi:hypothetical protein